jgi:hypothetical protein
MLEYIVRPFQAPNAHGTIIIPSTPKESTETAILTWGGEATLPAVQFIELGFAVKPGREDFVEETRDAETLRIYGEDPGDGPSYIDVRRSNKLYLDKSTAQSLTPAAPGQSGYTAAPPQVVNPGAGGVSTEPATTKTKATIELNNNTTAAG